MRTLPIAPAVSVIVALAIASQPVLGGQQPVFRAETQLVHVDVVVRDSKGEPVKGLTQADFEVLEDGKPQQVTTFAFEEITIRAAPIETVATLAAAAKELKAETGPAPATPAVASSKAVPTPVAPAPKPLTSDDVAGHRVWVLLFDTSSMQPEDVEKTAEAAIKWVTDKMTPADLVGLASIGTTLTPLVDLTSDRAKVLQALKAFTATDGTATAEVDASTMSTDETDTSTTDDTAATVDQSAQELDSFNNDVRLRGIKTICDALLPVEQRKALVYFSSGMARNGTDNQVELRSAENSCKRANVMIDTVDSRGLQAVAPFGSGRQRGGGGTDAFSGRGVQRQFTQLAAQQETLGTLAADTGGTAFLDSNDFGQAFDSVMKAISSYYILGYSSANTAKDGRFRNIEVRLKNTKTGYKIDRAREGYYADRDFAHTANTDREAQLQDQLYAGIPATDVPVFLTSGFFRLASRVQNAGRGFPGGRGGFPGGRGGGPGAGPGGAAGAAGGRGPVVPRDDHNFFVPISITLPGSAIPPNKDKVTLDIRGYIQDERRIPIGTIKDTLTVPGMTPEQLATHPVLYQTGMVMGPGRYTVKVVVRENSTGRMGSFETPVVVPDLTAAPVRVSSIVLSTQLAQMPPTAKKSDNPLIHDGIEILPNLTHVVSKDQHLYFYYEVYDPSGDATPQVQTGLAFYRGRTKVFETPVVERTSVDAADRHAAIFQFDVPASEFKTGLYTCQVNIVDEVAGKFAFPRLELYVR